MHFQLIELNALSRTSEKSTAYYVHVHILFSCIFTVKVMYLWKVCTDEPSTIGMTSGLILGNERWHYNSGLRPANDRRYKALNFYLVPINLFVVIWYHHHHQHYGTNIKTTGQSLYHGSVPNIRNHLPTYFLFVVDFVQQPQPIVAVPAR